jgi:hypothetical protein
MSSIKSSVGAALAAALITTALAPTVSVAYQSQDLRSPDARDAVEGLYRDLRSPDARDAAQPPTPVAQGALSGGADDNGGSELAMVLAGTAIALIGLGGGVFVVRRTMARRSRGSTVSS